MPAKKKFLMLVKCTIYQFDFISANPLQFKLNCNLVIIHQQMSSYMVIFIGILFVFLMIILFCYFFTKKHYHAFWTVDPFAILAKLHFERRIPNGIDINLFEETLFKYCMKVWYQVAFKILEEFYLTYKIHFSLKDMFNNKNYILIVVTCNLWCWT